jgi:carbon-monoxide dehydrogenase large subunit
VGGPAAFVNAVIDGIAHLGVRNIDMPCLSSRVWEAIKYKKDVPGTPPLPGT